ncbi:MAG TPA: DHH family phosphoesterase, partial [Candidatus Gracilibacteria bacterium]|nr:DHH family phosphoesterase [Candidatus Gracilibacteria bacterium]
MEKIRHQIVETIKRAQSILIMPSAPVDGDSLGSSLALYLALKKLGKEVTVVCADPVPDAFSFLPTTKVISHDFSAANDFIVTLDCRKSKLKTIRTKLEQDKVNVIITAKRGQFSAKDVSFHHGPSRYDLIITVDTGGLEQLGRFYEDNPELFVTVPLINIDHHASNDHFGKINLVDIMSSSTTELLIPLIQDFENDSGVKLMDEDIATLLLAGIITDTGSFQNANTTPKSFAAAAQLIKSGARQQEIIQHVFKTKKLSTLRLWGRILSRIKVDQKHRIAWSTISRKDLHETGSREDETGGIIDELMTNAPGIDIVMIIKEKEEGIVSGSIRTPNPSIDASAVAEMFGGGGHIQAAGFKIQSADIEKTEKMIIEKIQEFQKKRLNLTDEEAGEKSSHQMKKSVEEVRRETVKSTKIPQEKETLKEAAIPHQKEVV